MPDHTHKFTIADDDAVRTLIDKLLQGETHEIRDEKLSLAIEDAAQRYKDSGEEIRRAFFHGLLTGYSVAAKLG